MRADLSAHVLADHCRESVVEARSDTGGSDLIRIGVEVRPAMGHAWCGCAGHRHLGNIGGAEHGFDCARIAKQAVIAIENTRRGSVAPGGARAAAVDAPSA